MAGYSNQDPSIVMYCVSPPNQPLSIQLFVIIIEKGVKGFTQLTVMLLHSDTENSQKSLKFKVLQIK